MGTPEETPLACDEDDKSDLDSLPSWVLGDLHRMNHGDVLTPPAKKKKTQSDSAQTSPAKTKQCVHSAQKPDVEKNVAIVKQAAAEETTEPTKNVPLVLLDKVTRVPYIMVDEERIEGLFLQTPSSEGLAIATFPRGFGNLECDGIAYDEIKFVPREKQKKKKMTQVNQKLQDECIAAKPILKKMKKHISVEETPDAEPTHDKVKKRKALLVDVKNKKTSKRKKLVSMKKKNAKTPESSGFFDCPGTLRRCT